MNVTPSMLRLVVACLLLALSACGGGEDDGRGAQRKGTVIGAAGGTVVGPNGTKVVIPPGALPSDTTIKIEQTSVGAPALPDGVVPFGPMFAFTPHGTRFNAPVTVTMPFDAASFPAGPAPLLYKTNADKQWENVPSAAFSADSVSAQFTSFSFAGIVHTAPPKRDWLVVDLLRDGRVVSPDHDKDTQNEFATLDKPYDFGPALMLDPIDPVPEILPREFRATGRIYASAGGGVYSISGEAPNGPGLDRPAGNVINFSQKQGFRKKEENATLRLLVTVARIEASDQGSEALTQCVLPVSDLMRALCDGPMRSTIQFVVKAYTGDGATRRDFFLRDGMASLAGWRKHWTLSIPEASQFGERGRTLWNATHFNRDEDADQDGSGRRGRIELKQSVPVEVDLSSVEDEERFTLDVQAITSVLNLRRSEFSYLGAFLRDPQHIGGDVQVISDGLEPIGISPEPPTVDPTVPAGCAPGASPGTLHFMSPAESIGEAVAGSGATLFVSRTGGSDGEVSATIATRDGTATASADYVPVNTTVTFAAGDIALRAVNVPLIYSADAEPNHTFDVTLSSATGCASLGSPATITILDDTRPVPSSFSLGGTVSGLTGSGLVLVGGEPDLAITGNGPFTFGLPIPNGLPYDVRVKAQPTNPSQICTVTRGAGTIAGANVSNVAVDCTTSTVNAALDPTFGSAGKVTTGLAGVAMALQSDGRIVMLGRRTLARYNSDGSVDASFGASGQVSIVFNGGVQDAAQGLAIQPDGKVVVVGFTRVGTNDDFAVNRYDTSGTLDATFGTGGKASADFSAAVDKAWAVVIQPNGSIVVAGHASISSPLGGDNDFAVARFSSGGALDTSFGTGGKVTTNIAGRTDLAYAAVLQADGKVVLAGRVADSGGDSPDFGLVRYNVDGSLDTGFGASGIVRDVSASSWDEAADLVIQSDGKIVAAGFAAVGSFGFALTRFNADGSRDSGFGANGLVTTTLTTQDDYGRGVALQGDGKIVVVGQSSNLSKPDFGVVRYTANGTPDASFGTDGKLTVDFFGSGDDARDVAIQPDGKILVGGSAANGTSNGLGLIRINP